MGYHTRYELEAEPWPDSLSGLIGAEVGIYEDLAYALHPDGSSRDPRKWLEHERHMAEVSRQFPGVMFTLRGEGETTGDAWIKHFRDGRVQVRRVELVYPAFDPDGFR